MSIPGRRKVRPAVTEVAPLRRAARPVSNWPRVRAAHRRDVEVGQADRVAGEGVEVRRLQHRVAREREITEALVVGHHDQDVRLPGRAGDQTPGDRDQQQVHGHDFLHASISLVSLVTCPGSAAARSFVSAGSADTS